MLIYVIFKAKCTIPVLVRWQWPKAVAAEVATVAAGFEAAVAKAYSLGAEARVIAAERS